MAEHGFIDCHVNLWNMVFLSSSVIKLNFWYILKLGVSPQVLGPYIKGTA